MKLSSRSTLLAAALALTLLAVATQLFVGFDATNLLATCLVMSSALSVVAYLHWTRALDTHPLSTFALVGFCFTTHLGALWFQSLDGQALTVWLRDPLRTFGWLLAYQWTALVAHAAYRLLAQRRRPVGDSGHSLARGVLSGLGIYRTPQPAVLWWLGGMGLLGIAGTALPGTVGKLFQALIFLAWAPFLIPIFGAQGAGAYPQSRFRYGAVALYALLIVVVAVALNNRGAMLVGVMTVALFAVLAALQSRQAAPAWVWRRALVAVLLLGALAVPISELVTGMRIARKERGKVSAIEMIETTYEMLQRRDLIEEARRAIKTLSVGENYDEVYFRSELLNRLVETKFHDNALYFEGRLVEADQARVWRTSLDFLWATLPQPVLDGIDINVDKRDSVLSMGDHLYHLGGAGPVGGYRTGSGVAHGVALFGPLLLPVMLLVFPVVFWGIDLLSFRTAQGAVSVSALGYLGIWKLFQYGICPETLTNLVTALLRGLPQNVLLYALGLGLAAVFLPRAWRQPPAQRLPLLAPAAA